MSEELCGTRLDVEGFGTFCCAEPIDHDGPCRPALAHCLRQIAYHTRIAAAMSEYVAEHMAMIEAGV